MVVAACILVSSLDFLTPIRGIDLSEYILDSMNFCV